MVGIVPLRLVRSVWMPLKTTAILPVESQVPQPAVVPSLLVIGKPAAVTGSEDPVDSCPVE